MTDKEQTSGRLLPEQKSFRIEGPARVSFSGGRTSAYMLRRILDAHGGELPPDVVVTFANTGKEFPATLDFVRDCGERWGVRIHWLEWAPPADGHFREVSHATASRKGEPFEAMVEYRGYMPNPVARLCTENLKIKVQEAFAKSLGWGEHTRVLGLRADEPGRVARRRAADPDAAMPLATAGVTKAAVLAFWRAQPFDLALRPWESNCDLCYLKGPTTVRRIIRDHPEAAAWWAAMEARRGMPFRTDRPTYAALAARVRASPLLPIFNDPPPDDAEGIACACTD